MAMVLTSFTPAGGPCTGGTKVVITGTGLTAATSVMFGDVQGAIDTTAANTATSLTVLAPAIPNADAGAKKITLLDSVTPGEVQSSTSYTYTTVTTPALSTSLASKWKFQIDTSVAQDGTAWTDVRGVTNLQPAIDQTTQDDSDYDTGLWGSDVVTQFKWSLVCKVDRKVASGYTEDPGQEALRVASFAATDAGRLVHVRFYDRNGGAEAYEGSGNVKWSDDGGATSDKSSVSVTVMGRGERLTITNPAV